MPLTVLVFEKNGTIKELTIKKFNELELYKKAGLKSSNGFNNRTIWNIDGIKGKSYHLSLFGNIDGRANSENKYEFPPPVDNTLFFGNCILINKDDDDVPIDITQKEWTEIYDHLYGGFDDIGDENDDEDTEEDEDDDLPRTKSGYVKDGFIVDDEEEDEEEDVYIKPKRKPVQIKTKKSRKPDPALVNNFISNEKQSNYLECTGELSEDEYI